MNLVAKKIECKGWVRSFRPGRSKKIVKINLRTYFCWAKLKCWTKFKWKEIFWNKLNMTALYKLISPKITLQTEKHINFIIWFFWTVYQAGINREPLHFRVLSEFCGQQHFRQYPQRHTWSYTRVSRLLHTRSESLQLLRALISPTWITNSRSVLTQAVKIAAHRPAVQESRDKMFTNSHIFLNKWNIGYCNVLIFIYYYLNYKQLFNGIQ